MYRRSSLNSAFVSISVSSYALPLSPYSFQISDETYALRRSIGCTLPRDIVHPPTGLDPSSSSSTSQNRKRVSDDNRESPNHAGLAKRTKDGMDADGPDEAGYEKVVTTYFIFDRNSY